MQVPNIKLQRNLCSGSRADACGRTDGWTDMTKLRGAFRDYAEAPKMRLKRGENTLITAALIMGQSKLA